MTNWPVKTLGEVCEVSRGTSITRKETTAGTVPVVAGGVDVAYFHSIANRESGCITVSSSGANAGFVNRWSMPIFASDCSTVISRSEGLVLSDFAFRFLQSKQYFINSELRRGAAQPHVYAKDIAAIEIPVPPLDEQKRIVALLDAATAHVTELSACYERARTHANNLFTSALRDELEGNLDWPVKTLGDVCEVFDDGDWIESKDQAPSGVRLIQTGNVGDGEFKNRSDKARFISESTFSRLRCTEIIPGDLLVSRLPDPVGRACLIPDTGSKMITAVDCTIMRPSKDIMLPQFLVSSTQTSAYREQVRAKITGTTRDRISRSNLAEVQVSVPSLEEQKRIVARLDSMRAKTSEMTAAYDAKLTAAKNLRQSILEAAFARQL